MGCPICGRVYCDHSPAERGQSSEEMMADCYGMSVEKYKKGTNPTTSTEKKSTKRPKKRKTHTIKKK